MKTHARKTKTATKITVFIALAILLLSASASQAQVSPLQGTGFTQWFDNNGTVLTNGVLYSYAAGTTTQQATYTDSSGLTQNPNPIPFTTGGRVNVWLLTGSFYKLVLCSQNDGAFCAAGDILASADQIPGGSTSSGGVASSPFISATASPATSGILRLASSDTVCWRNAAGSANLCWSKDANDLLSWTGGQLKFPETACPLGSVGFDLLCTDASAHRWKMANNGGSVDFVLGAATADTLTNKTYDAQGAGNVFKIGGTTITNTGQGATTFLRGDGVWVTANDAAFGTGGGGIGAGSASTCSTPGFGTNQCNATVFPGPHTLLRLTYTIVTSPAGCAVALVVGVRDNTSTAILASLTVSNGAGIGFVDSGALSVAMTGGDQFGVGVITASSGCGTNPVIGNVTMVYR